MESYVFTISIGLDYQLRPNVLLRLAVAHSRGEMDSEKTEVRKGGVDITLTSLFPCALESVTRI